MLSPTDPRAPKFWRYETGGKLVPAIERYLRHEPGEAEDVDLIRAYLRQWIDSPAWGMNWEADAQYRRALAELRASVRAIHTRKDVTVWLEAALEEGIDPL